MRVINEGRASAWNEGDKRGQNAWKPEGHRTATATQNIIFTKSSRFVHYSNHGKALGGVEGTGGKKRCAKILERDQTTELPDAIFTEP